MTVFARLRRLRTRRALPPGLRARLAGQKSRRERLRTDRETLAQPLALARYVVLDLETTGPRMMVDTIISIGAVAVAERAIRHDDAFERVLRQPQSSAHDNILVHQIGGQAQAAGDDPASALVDFLEHLAASIAVAFRAEFDATVLTRETEARLGILLPTRFLDHAIADAYAEAQLWLLALEQAHRAGLRTVGDLVELERAQRWLGKRH